MTTDRTPVSDAYIRGHLTRRSAGIAPDAESIFAALDRVPVVAPRRLAPSRRVGIAGSLVALAAVVALVAVALPALRGTGSQGSYPAQRALTAAELGRVVQGTRPSEGTTLVADVSIAAAPASCTAVGRYHVVGSIAGGSPTLCVVGLVTPPRSGILAFRLVGDGILGYVTEIHAASSRLAFSTGEQWPSSPFLVEGFLGGSGWLYSCVWGPARPDPLDPTHDPSRTGALVTNCPYVDWLADRPDSPWIAVGPPEDHPAASWARTVNAESYYFSLPGSREDGDRPRPAVPEHGVYLVIPEQNQWNVVARVDPVTIPPVVTNAKLAPLSTAQLQRAIDAGTISANATLLVRTSIDIKPDACPMNRYPTVGVIDGVSPEICVMGGGHGPTPTATSGRLDGLFVLRFIGERSLGYLGSVTTPAAALTYRVGDEWPLKGDTFLVDGWLGATRRSGCPYPTPALDPMSDSDAVCWSGDWLSADGKPLDLSVAAAAPLPSTASELELHGNARAVRAAWAAGLAGIPLDRRLASPIHGVYAIQSQTAGCPGQPEVSSIGCGVWRILGKLDETPAEAPKPAVTPSAPVVRTETPTSFGWTPLQRPLTPAEVARIDTVTDRAAVAVDGTLVEAGGQCPQRSPGKVFALDGAPICVWADSDAAKLGPVLVIERLGPGSGAEFRLLGSVERTAFAVPASPDAPHASRLVTSTMTSPVACVNAVAPDPSFDPVTQPAPPPPICHAKLTGHGEMTADAGSLFDARPEFKGRTVPGVFLVDYAPRCSQVDSSQCETWRVTARLDDVSIGAQPVLSRPPAGVAAAAGKPLSFGEFAAMVVTNPAAMDARIALVSSAGRAGCTLSNAVYPGGDRCDATAGGVQAVRSKNGLLQILGPLASDKAVSVKDAVGAAATAKGGLFLVDGWLAPYASLDCDELSYPPDSDCGAGASSTLLADDPSKPTETATILLRLGDLQRFAADPSAVPARGLYLVRGIGAEKGCPLYGPCGRFGSLVARIDLTRP